MHLLARTKRKPSSRQTRPCHSTETGLYLYLLGTSGRVSTQLEVHLSFQGATACRHSVVPVSSLSLRRQLSSAWEVDEMTTNNQLVTAYMSAVPVEQTAQCTVADRGDMSAANGLFHADTWY